eukprot:3863541-Rhodomonas_salina.1
MDRFITSTCVVYFEALQQMKVARFTSPEVERLSAKHKPRFLEDLHNGFPGLAIARWRNSSTREANGIVHSTKLGGDVWGDFLKYTSTAFCTGGENVKVVSAVGGQSLQPSCGSPEKVTLSQRVFKGGEGWFEPALFGERATASCYPPVKTVDGPRDLEAVEMKTAERDVESENDPAKQSGGGGWSSGALAGMSYIACSMSTVLGNKAIAYLADIRGMQQLGAVFFQNAVAFAVMTASARKDVSPENMRSVMKEISILAF